MSSPEAMIAAGRAVIALDANAITGFRRLQHVCNLVNRLRAPPAPDDIRLYVPAVVHMEVLFDLRQRYGSTFDAQLVTQGLIDKGLEILPFERRHADNAAAWLGVSFPEEADWHAAKRRRCVQCLGLREQDVRAPGTGRKCGATIDLAVAAQAAQEGWILVTDDKDPEFEGLALKISLERLERALADRVAQRLG